MHLLRLTVREWQMPHSVLALFYEDTGGTLYPETFTFKGGGSRFRPKAHQHDGHLASGSALSIMREVHAHFLKRYQIGANDVPLVKVTTQTGPRQGHLDRGQEFATLVE